MFKVEFISKRVKKEFQTFTKAEQQCITDAMNLLSTNPRPIHLGFGQLNSCADVKRIKIGRVRVFYTINEGTGTVWIGKLDQCDSSTYKVDPREWFRRIA